MMPSKSNLPQDWKVGFVEYVEANYRLPKRRRDDQCGISTSYIAAILTKKELDEAASAVWHECCRNGKDITGFYDDMVGLFHRMRTYPPGDIQFRHTTRASHLAIVKALEIVREEWCCPPKIRDENLGDEEITWENMTKIIDSYRKRAEQSTNYKGKAAREHDTLWILMIECRLLKIKYWVKVTSPLMRIEFGPTWTANYTKRRTADWKLNQEIAKEIKDGQWPSLLSSEVPNSE